MRSLFKKLKKGKEKSWVSNSYWKKQQANKIGREIFSSRHILNILSPWLSEKHPRLSCRVEVASNGLVEPIHHLRVLLAEKTPTLSSSWYPRCFVVVISFVIAVFHLVIYSYTFDCDDHCRKMSSECVVRPYFLCVWFIGWFWTTLRASQSVLTNTNPFPHYKCVQLFITTKDCQISEGWYDSKLHKKLHRK